MMLFLKKIYNFIHGFIQMILLGRGKNSDNGILFMKMRRIVADDDLATRRPCPIFDLKAF